MATDAAPALPSLPHPSNYTAEPGRLFGWGSAKRESAFPGAETIDAAKHICYPGLGPSKHSMTFSPLCKFLKTDTKTETSHNFKSNATICVPLEHLFGGKKFSQISADTGVFAALEEDGDVLVWSTSDRSGFGGEGGGGVTKLSKKARRISVGDKSVWVVEVQNLPGNDVNFPGKESGKLKRNREGERRLWRFRGSIEAPSLCDKFRTVGGGGALLERPFVEEVSACGGGVLAIVQFDDDSGNE